MFDKLPLEKIGKQAAAQIIRQAEENIRHYRNCAKSAADDKAHFERKVKNETLSLRMVKKLIPALLEYLKPPKPFKMPKMTKKRRAEIRREQKMYPNSRPLMPGVPVAVSAKK